MRPTWFTRRGQCSAVLQSWTQGSWSTSSEWALTSLLKRYHFPFLTFFFFFLICFLFSSMQYYLTLWSRKGSTHAYFHDSNPHPSKKKKTRITLHPLPKKIHNNSLCSLLPFISIEWELGETEKRQEQNRGKGGWQIWKEGSWNGGGLCFLYMWEVGSAPWPAGGVSRWNLDLGESAGFAVILEVWGWDTSLARGRQT